MLQKMLQLCCTIFAYKDINIYFHQNIGVNVLTSMRVDVRPCIDRSIYGVYGGKEVAYMRTGAGSGGPIRPIAMRRKCKFYQISLCFAYIIYLEALKGC